MTPYFVYILECSDSTLYSGISTDPLRRLKEHNQGALGAKYTRARRPVRLVYVEECSGRSLAQRREHALKKMSRSQKQLLIAGFDQPS